MSGGSCSPVVGSASMVFWAGQVTCSTSLTSTSSLNTTLLFLSPEPAPFMSMVTKLEGNNPSPLWLDPFHQLGSASSRIITISPALKVSSLSSAASKSYKALAFFSSSFLTEADEDIEAGEEVGAAPAEAPENKLSEGYKTLLTLLDLEPPPEPLPLVSCNDNWIALAISSSSCWLATAMGSDGALLFLTLSSSLLKSIPSFLRLA